MPSASWIMDREAFWVRFLHWETNKRRKDFSIETTRLDCWMKFPILHSIAGDKQLCVLHSVFASTRCHLRCHQIDSPNLWHTKNKTHTHSEWKIEDKKKTTRKSIRIAKCPLFCCYCAIYANTYLCYLRVTPYEYDEHCTISLTHSLPFVVLLNAHRLLLLFRIDAEGSGVRREWMKSLRASVTRLLTAFTTQTYFWFELWFFENIKYLAAINASVALAQWQ